MRRNRPTSMLAMLLVALTFMAFAVPAIAANSYRPTGSRSSQTADLGAALASDGTFHGARGMAGTVDASKWALVSNLARGDAPRFAPNVGTVSPAVVTPVGPWSALGSNGAGNGALNGRVLAIAISGTDVYVGGEFTNAANIAEADYIAKWNGSAWSALGSNGLGNGALSSFVYALAVSGTDLYVGGLFENAGAVAEADRIAKWNGSSWSAVGYTNGGCGNFNTLCGPVNAIAVSGSDVYAGGNFLNGAGIPEADYLAKWNGSTWSALGSNGAGVGALNGNVRALAVSGSDLFVGGYFTDAAGNVEADRVAKWNGSSWSALGSNGAGNGAIGFTFVDALAVSGSNLFVGGLFVDVAGIATADNVAEWNGSAWSALGSNGAGNGAIATANGVHALAVVGSDLFVAGYFSDVAGNAAADRVAKWSGSTWSALGSNGSGNGAISSGTGERALASSSTALFVGGGFGDAAGIATADYIAKWTLPVLKPDGRIRLGTGAYIGDNVYNTTGVNQAKTGSKAKGKTVKFSISVQNDSAASADTFKLIATGTASAMYTVKYFHGTTDITAAVVAGTYTTPTVAAGGAYVITVKVKVNTTATVGSSITRLVTIASVGDNTKQDAVSFTGKRL